MPWRDNSTAEIRDWKCQTPIFENLCLASPSFFIRPSPGNITPTSPPYPSKPDAKNKNRKWDSCRGEDPHLTGNLYTVLCEVKKDGVEERLHDKVSARYFISAYRRKELTARNVPGRKNMVTAAIVIIEALSCWVFRVSSAVNSAISLLARLSAWFVRWNSWKSDQCWKQHASTSAFLPGWFEYLCDLDSR